MLVPHPAAVQGQDVLVLPHALVLENQQNLPGQMPQIHPESRRGKGGREQMLFPERHENEKPRLHSSRTEAGSRTGGERDWTSSGAKKMKPKQDKEEISIPLFQ